MPALSASRPWWCSLAVLLAAAGCAGPAPQWTASITPTPAMGASSFPGAAAILQGFDARDDAERWLPGDTVLYGVRFTNGEDVRSWLLLFRVLEEPSSLSMAMKVTVGFEEMTFESRLMKVAVVLHDGDGKHLSSCDAQVPEAFLRRGLFAACATAARYAAAADGQRVTSSKESAREFAAGIVSLLSVLRTVQRMPMLADILWEVIEKPSFLSVLLHLGVTVDLNTHFDRVATVDQPLPGSPWASSAYRLPVEVGINGTPALYLGLLVTEPQPPLQLASGIVAIDGVHPSKSTTRLSMQLLAARRGTATAGPTSPFPDGE